MLCYVNEDGGMGAKTGDKFSNILSWTNQGSIGIFRMPSEAHPWHVRQSATPGSSVNGFFLYVFFFYCVIKN